MTSTLINRSRDPFAGVGLRRSRRPEPTAEQAAVLVQARQAQVDAQRAEARKLAAGVQWAALHQVDDLELAETWPQTPVTLAGQGAPMIATGCVAEFGVVIGMGTNAARYYLSDAIELAHRLPNLYALTQAGKLNVSKARRISNQTIDLTPQAAAEIDLRLAPVAAKISGAATDKIVHQVIVELMPAYAQELIDMHSDPKVIVDHRSVSFQGTSKIAGSLDLADALDLDDALNREAAAMQEAGSTDSLDVRRARALGRLARGETNGSGREVTLYVHLPADTDATAIVDNKGSRLLTQAQVAIWCGNPDVRVTVKPVIDLNETISTAAYVATDKIKEHLQLRDKTCVFAYCTKQATNCDCDHTKEHADGGETSTCNLACLCRHHHNLKTHGGWSYITIEPGVYLWRSPHGYTLLRDHDGSTQLLTTDPPES